MKLNSLKSVYPLVKTLYNVTIDENLFEDIALIGWQLIGNKYTRLYRYVGDTHNRVLQLPCNVDMIESVTCGGEDIARYNPLYTINSIAGQCRGTLSYTMLTGKKIANFARLLDFLSKYLNGVNYRKCITVDEEFKNKWLHIKLNDKPFTKESAAEQIKEMAEELDALQAKGEELYKKRLDELK